MKKFMTRPTAVATTALLALGTLGVAAADDYKAYINVQGSKYTFRNAWNDGDFGRDSQAKPVPAEWTYDAGLIGWVEEGADNYSADLNGAAFFPATITDATVSGTGWYSVGMSDITWNGDSTLNLLFVSTEIPMQDGYLDEEYESYLYGVCPEAHVYMNGSEVFTTTDVVQNPDEADYVNIQFINLWNSDLEVFTYPDAPETIQIDLGFTFNGEELPEYSYTSLFGEAGGEEEPEPTEAPKEEDPKPTEAPKTDSKADTKADTTKSDSKDSNTGLLIGIIAGVVVLCAIIIGVVASKKKK